MDTGWAALMAAWRDFYLLAAMGAAVLAGALVVAAAVNADALAGPAGRSLRGRGAQALIVCGGVFFAGLLLLAPGASAAGAAWELALVGVGAATGGLAPLAGRARAPGARGAPWLAPLLFGAALLGLAGGLAGGDAGLLPLVAAALALGLLAGAALAGRLLADLPAARQAWRDEQRDAGRDRGLERQIRALMREQRALNRRQQEQAHAAGAGAPARAHTDRAPHG
jgi:hypothetical protein